MDESLAMEDDPKTSQRKPTDAPAPMDAPLPKGEPLSLEASIERMYARYDRTFEELAK